MDGNACGILLLLALAVPVGWFLKWLLFDDDRRAEIVTVAVKEIE